MNPRRRRRALLGIGAVLAVVLVVGGLVAVEAIEIGVAHKAKTLCSGVFVSGRDPAAVLAELHADDSAILQDIHASIDSAQHSVTATALGVVARRAVYRQGLGCALVLDGLTPPTAPAGRETMVAPAGVLQRDSAAAIEGAGARDSEAAVARAFSEPHAERRRRTLAVVVVYRGKIVVERYATGIGPDTPLAGWSMTKSVMNALAGILVKQGRLVLDDPVPIPEWKQTSDARASITLDHLLRMSSGLRFDEEMASPRSDVMRMLYQVGDAAAFAAKMDSPSPGTRWQYSSGTSNILARAMRNVLDDENWVPDLSAARPVRPARHVERSDGDRRQRHVRGVVIHVRDGTGLGAIRNALPARWCVERRASAPGGMGHLHDVARTSGQQELLRRALLAAGPRGIWRRGRSPFSACFSRGGARSAVRYDRAVS